MLFKQLLSGIWNLETYKGKPGYTGDKRYLEQKWYICPALNKSEYEDETFISY